MEPRPADLETMTDLRAEIDRTDRALLALLARRAALIDRAIEIKGPAGLPARIEARVEEVASQARAVADAEGLDGAAVEALWRMIIEWSIAREERVLGADLTP